jgi:hypothetical protein
MLGLIKKFEQFIADDSMSVFVQTLAKSALLAFDRKLAEGFITPIHRMANFFDPRNRKMNRMEPLQRSQVKCALL